MNRSEALTVPDFGPWLDVDLDALLANARTYAAQVGVPLLPMVKANGYGLGACSVASVLRSLGPWGFGVATLAEAAELRRAGIDEPLVVFVPFQPSAADSYRQLRARPSIGSVAELEAWTAGGVEPFHLAVDTGMGRGGVPWWDGAQVDSLRSRLAGAVGFEGAFTHFHSADRDAAATREQWRRFEELLASLERLPPVRHAANSAAGLVGSRYAGTAARPGIFLYGGGAGPIVPRPVATLSAAVLAVRPIRAGDSLSYGATYRAPGDADVVTLGIGYADGVHRALGNRGLVGFARGVWPIAGRVTMDMVMVVVPKGAVQVGESAELFGATVGLDEQAARADTIGYELLTSVGRRVTRRYRGGTPS